MVQRTHKLEFGDFQTPYVLAANVVRVLRSLGIAPRAIVEPTCGTGAFLLAASRGFESLRALCGLEINESHLSTADACIRGEGLPYSVDLRSGDFFEADWADILQRLPHPLLILGNPPWVTASGLGVIGGGNAPVKSNFQNHRGLDALTGKSNFDIAEWMLLHLLGASAGMEATMAMLVKTHVARRVLLHAWRWEFPIVWSHVYQIDAARHFGVSADACLFVCHLGAERGPEAAEVFALDAPTKPLGRIGYRQGHLIADVDAYEATKHLLVRPAQPSPYRWRSGVKHDCAAIMELRRTAKGRFVNGLEESVELEEQFVYPMFKGSDVATGRINNPRRYMIVPQQRTGQDTVRIQTQAPRTWQYLVRHQNMLNARKSSIYRKRPPFSVFGVGPYTFTPWKVAICGLYKRLDFALVGPCDDRPVVFDDTVYSIPCRTFDEASLLVRMLTCEKARHFFQARVFWDTKRPITADILNRLDLGRLAKDLELDGEFSRWTASPHDAVSLFE